MSVKPAEPEFDPEEVIATLQETHEQRMAMIDEEIEHYEQTCATQIEECEKHREKEEVMLAAQVECLENGGSIEDMQAAGEAALNEWKASQEEEAAPSGGSKGAAPTTRGIKKPAGKKTLADYFGGLFGSCSAAPAPKAKVVDEEEDEEELLVE